MTVLAEGSNITLPFTWGQLLGGVLMVIGAIALIVLIVVLIRLAKTLKKVNSILDDNKKNIDDTLNKVPSIASSADETLKNVNSITGSVDDVVTDVTELVETFTKPEGPAGIIASISGAVVSAIQVVRDILKKK